MVTLKGTYGNETMRLICRETDSLIVEVIRHRVMNNQELESQRQYNGLIFLLKLQESNSVSPERTVYIVCICQLK